MLRLFLLALLAFALSGCATLPDEQPVTDLSHTLWQQRLLHLGTLKQWHVRGRVALFIKDDVYNLGLDWQRNGDDSTLKLEAALGQGMVQLSSHTGAVKLETSEGKSYFGNNAEQVLKAATGWSLPVAGLQSWIKGVPHPRSDYLPDINVHGHARLIRQDGWKINFIDYQKVRLRHFGEVTLPEKLYLKRDQVALKIVIDQWQNQSDSPIDDVFPQFPG